MTCGHLLNGAPDCVFCHRDQLRGELTLAEEGLASYQQENHALRNELTACQLERDRLQRESDEWDKTSLVQIVQERDRLRDALLHHACDCGSCDSDPTPHAPWCPYRKACLPEPQTGDKP